MVATSITVQTDVPSARENVSTYHKFVNEPKTVEFERLVSRLQFESQPKLLRTAVIKYIIRVRDNEKKREQTMMSDRQSQCHSISMTMSTM